MSPKLTVVSTGLGLATYRQSIAQADLAAGVRDAQENFCPYSHATRGNVVDRDTFSCEYICLRPLRSEFCT
jgi:organic hydroperoxide reductase OsmC/OhrA